MIVLTLFPPISGAILLLLLAGLLLHGPFRQYPLLLVYCCTQLVILIVEGVAFFSAGISSALYRRVYWSADLLHDSMLFLLVISLLYKTMEGGPLPRATGRLLGIIAAGAVVLPFVIYHPYFTSRWFRHASQLLSLGAAFMNLLLWTAIIGTRKRDDQLLKVSAGLGIAVTGLAVYYGILQFVNSSAVRWLPDLFNGLTHVAGIAIWCWAFWPGFARPQLDKPAGRVAVGQI